MNTISTLALEIFHQSVVDYHRYDDINHSVECPFDSHTIEGLLYHKNWIDTVQWHYEDLIRDPDISPPEALDLKRKIDSSNQRRTDLVEKIDDYFLDKFRGVKPQISAVINTESPAWAIDRLSILELKIFHMNEEACRSDAEEKHIERCRQKLRVLQEQRLDLAKAIDRLLEDIAEGRRYMKVYRQMKMYNDESLNPVLYKGKK